MKKNFFSEHHLSHAASILSIPLKDALILTADGVGEWATTSVSSENKIKLTLKEIHFPSSIGLLYSALIFYWFKK